MGGARWTKALAGILTLLLTGATARAGSGQELLDAQTRAQVAEEAARVLEESYVSPEVGRQLARLLRQGGRSDAWAEATTPQELARRLTADMARVADDLHLRVEVPGEDAGRTGAVPVRSVVRGAPRPDDPAAANARAATPVREGQAGPPASSLPVRRSPPTSPKLPSSFRVSGMTGVPTLDDLPPGMRAHVDRERRENHYFRRAEHLPGNVGYLDLEQFPIMPYAAPAADAAMQFLADVEAFVLDLRGNPGGGEGMNQYLGSFFFADSVHLYSRYYRPDDETREYWTLPHLTPVTLSDVPLFVLVDGRSGSAAENMAFNLSRTGRATVVGETTAGAGNSSTRVDLPGGFTLVVPIARVYDPRTGDGFEGTGVEPDVQASSEEALVVAHGLAVDALLERTDDVLRGSELEQARALFAARSAPALPAEALEEYAGNYGSRRIWVEDGRLMLQRTDVPDAPALVLLRIGPDRFVLEALPDAQIEFRREADGAIRSVRVRQSTGSWEESSRR